LRYALAVLIAVFCLMYFLRAVGGHTEPRLIIMGDSLSTTHESWPNFLREMAPRWNVQVMAQNGRTIRDFSMPRDLWTTGLTNETVIYFLGGNDMLQRNDIGHATARLKSHIQFLLDRNFKVLLIIPPKFNIDEAMFGRSVRQHRELIESYRGTNPNLWVYDMDQIWDSSHTPDGVHPDADLSWEIAAKINIVLYMNIY
jgi:hypothetical protein